MNIQQRVSCKYLVALTVCFIFSSSLYADVVTQTVNNGWASCLVGCTKKSSEKPTRKQDILGGPYTPNPLARNTNGDIFYPPDYPFLGGLILTHTYTNYYTAAAAGVAAKKSKDSEYVYDFTWNKDDKSLVKFSLPFSGATPIKGGLFISPRTLSSRKRASYKKKYGHDFTSIYGKNGRRIHGGIDYGGKKGQTVFAPISGEVVGFVYLPSYTGSDGKSLNFKGVAIRHKSGVLARCLYITPQVRLRQKVKAGETKIGILRDLSQATSLKGTLNHVHCDFTDTHCRRFDPYANTYVDATDYKLCKKSKYVLKK